MSNTNIPPATPGLTASTGDPALDQTMQPQGQDDVEDPELEDSNQDMQNVTHGRRSAHVRVPVEMFNNMVQALDDVKQLREEVALLQKQRLSQQQVAVSSIPASTTNSATSALGPTTNPQQGSGMRATPAKPKEFNGITDLKGVGNVTAREFLNQLYLYFENVKLSDREMATCAASYMVGEAGSWATARLKTLKAQGKVDSWAEFEAEFRKLYCPISVANVARSQLNLLRQGKTSVAEYYQKFQRLCLEIPNMDGATSLDWFVKGLNKALHEKVFLQQPKTLDEAFTHATQLEGLYQIMGSHSLSSLTVMQSDEEPKTATSHWEQQLSQMATTIQQQQQQLSALTQQRFGNNNINGGNKNDKTRGDVPKCDHCKKRGHSKEKCWKLHPELEPEWMKLKRETTTISKK